MGDAYVTLPLGEDSENIGYSNELEPSVPEQTTQQQRHAFLPRPPATAPIRVPESQPASKFDVQVCEPTKSGNGYNAFVVYKVMCRTSMENYASSDIIANRRFNHFVWLHVQLSEQYPCYFIPVLPDKSGIDPLFNRFDAEFIERRRWALNMFLVRVVQHPVHAYTNASTSFVCMPRTATFACTCMHMHACSASSHARACMFGVIILARMTATQGLIWHARLCCVRLSSVLSCFPSIHLSLLLVLAHTSVHDPEHA
jgi:hypothetical protein